MFSGQTRNTALLSQTIWLRPSDKTLLDGIKAFKQKIVMMGTCNGHYLFITAMVTLTKFEGDSNGTGNENTCWSLPVFQRLWPSPLISFCTPPDDAVRYIFFSIIIDLYIYIYIWEQNTRCFVSIDIHTCTYRHIIYEYIRDCTFHFQWCDVWTINNLKMCLIQG